MALVLPPRAGDFTAFTDDAVVNALMCAAFCDAQTHSDMQVILDTSLDQDRGYVSSIDLIGRRANPCPTFHALPRPVRGGGSTQQTVAATASVVRARADRAQARMQIGMQTRV